MYIKKIPLYLKEIINIKFKKKIHYIYLCENNESNKNLN